MKIWFKIFSVRNLFYWGSVFWSFCIELLDFDKKVTTGQSFN